MEAYCKAELYEQTTGNFVACKPQFKNVLSAGRYANKRSRKWRIVNDCGMIIVTNYDVEAGNFSLR